MDIERIINAINKYGPQVEGYLNTGYELNKFNATIGPVMIGQAVATGLPVYAFWFGQIVQATPQSRTFAQEKVSTIGEYNRIIQEKESMSQSFYTFDCGAGLKTYSASEIASRCSFIPHGRLAIQGGNPITDPITGIINPPGNIPVGDFAGYLPLAALGVGAYFLFFRK